MGWICAVLLTALALAQTTRPPSPAQTAPSNTAWPIESLTIEGNRLYPTEKILTIAGLKVGQMVVPKDFEAARQRLLATGAFHSVSHEFKPGPKKTGYAGRIELSEIEQTYPYRFEDLPAADQDLRAAIQKAEPLFGDRLPGTKEVLERFAAVVRGALGGKTEVIGRIISDDPGQVAIVFRPPTPRPSIAEVWFKGNEVLPASLLQNTLSGVAVGTLYTEARVRQLLDSSIRPLYDARGRIRVKFPKISTTPAKNVNGLAVTIEVEEGPSFKLGEVLVRGTTVTSAELVKLGGFKPGELADFDRIKEGLERIHQSFRRKGYLKATSKTERRIDDTKQIVDLDVTVEPGAQYFFRKLEIAGLDVISEPAIRKMWSLKPGEPFNPEYPDYFLKRIRDDGIFDNLGKTRSERAVDEKEKAVDVKLYFAGGGEGTKPKKDGPPGRELVF